MPYLYIDGAYQYIDGVYYSDIRFWAILDAVLTGDLIFCFHLKNSLYLGYASKNLDRQLYHHRRNRHPP